MKAIRKIKLIRYNTWFPSIKQLYLIPSIILTYDSYGSFIEHGVGRPMYNISLLWLNWGLILKLYWDLEDE